MPVLRFDHEMGDRRGDQVNDHPGQLTTDPVAAAGVGPIVNRVVSAIATPLRSYGLWPGVVWKTMRTPSRISS
jgi:hypothetical protein